MKYSLGGTINVLISNHYTATLICDQKDSKKTEKSITYYYDDLNNPSYLKEIVNSSNNDDWFKFVLSKNIYILFIFNINKLKIIL